MKIPWFSKSVSTKKPIGSRPVFGSSGDDPLWFKDAVIYQIHLRAFSDGDGDGMGDFRGLTSRLGYLADLGVTTLWLLPFYPSPWRDDGYDISDYHSVHSKYGTLRDFQAFLREAHSRGLRIITELVINHTSDQHEWFQRARRAAPGTTERDFYVWHDNSSKYSDARIIFKDFETSNWSWDPVANAYFWHRFYSHQPDLNFDSPAVCDAILEVADFWLEMGVDGLRLDAVPYLFEREGTSCENLPETHGFLKRLRKHIDEKYAGRMLLAEANQWPEDAAAYFGSGDECHMAFHFPVMPRLFMAIHLEARFSIVDILNQTPAIPDSCQWAMFLRNHDELTLEMVTDEERDYMYRAYAAQERARINLGIRRRLAPLLGNNRRRIELMNSLLFSMPGTPVIYYGDELGMGDNIFLGDRNGVRTPMQWSPDRNAGFSTANPQQLYLPVISDPEYHYEALNVEIQQSNSASLLWWMKRVIALRKKDQVFGRGSLEFLYPENRKVLAFIRSYEKEHVLVVANLSRFSQYVEIDLSKFVGHEPVELFGSARFRVIREEPYMLTLGPHSFFWFALEPSSAFLEAASAEKEDLIALTIEDDVLSALTALPNDALERAIIQFLTRARWFGGKGRRIREISSALPIPLDHSPSPFILLVVDVAYADGEDEKYLLTLAHFEDARAAEILKNSPQGVLVSLKRPDGSPAGILADPLPDAAFGELLLDIIRARRNIRGEADRLVGVSGGFLRTLAHSKEELIAAPLGAEQSNSSLVYRTADGTRVLTLKLIRRLQPGENPEVEIGRFLAQVKGFDATPQLAGSIEFEGRHGQTTFAVAHGFIPNEGDAWPLTLDAVSSFMERALAWAAPLDEPPALDIEQFCSTEFEPTDTAVQLIGQYIELAERLGQRTAELHNALGSKTEDPSFSAEPFTDHYKRGLYQSIRGRFNETLYLVKKQLKTFTSEVTGEAQKFIDASPQLLTLLNPLIKERILCKRIRIHGDFHLGQVLYTGTDFVIIDFEGEPARSISERRIKRSPLVDVAGMLRSFDYAAQTVLHRVLSQTALPEERREVPALAAQYWTRWIEAAFLSSYFQNAAPGGLIPESAVQKKILLTCYLLEKASYEVRYELNNRPHWIWVPLRGIARISTLFDKPLRPAVTDEQKV